MEQQINNAQPSTSSYRDSLKSMDTEEHIDLAFYRPIGYMWACLAKKLGVTPNAITIASIFLGIGAGVMFYFNDLWLNVIGMLLLIWANSFDSADGQLARMTKQYSRIGRILDGLSGDFWFATIYVAICLRTNVTSEFFSQHHWVIWVTAVVTGICHAKQAAMADYYRQFHLYFLKGEDGSELESAADLKSKLAELSWKHNFWKKLTLTFYTNYTINQEAWTPRMQALRAELKRRLRRTHPAVVPRRIPRQEPAADEVHQHPVVQLAHDSPVCIALPADAWLYFAFELTVLNILLAGMVIRHENICKTFTKELEDGKY